jgi:hypothetical protein
MEDPDFAACQSIIEELWRLENFYNVIPIYNCENKTCDAPSAL